MKQIYFCIAMTVFALILVGCAQKLSPMEEADLTYNAALDQQASGEHEAAIAEFKQYLGQFPQSQDADNAQLGIGDSYYAQGQFQRAIEAYQAITTQYPTSDSVDIAQLKIGDAYMTQGEFSQASVAYQKLIEKYPYLEVEAAQLAGQRLDMAESVQELRGAMQTAAESIRDNMQYHIAMLYLEELADYRTAIGEFQKVIDIHRDSELADNAAWLIGECYWQLGQQESLPPLGEVGEAFTRLQHIVDRYPQFAERERYDTDGYPHSPAGKRGDRYEMYFAEVRRMLNRHPNLKAQKWSDFVPENYQRALEAWDSLLLNYPNTDATSAAPKKIAEQLVQLGQTYKNISAAGSYADLSGTIYKTSLSYWPTPEAHIALAYYYTEVRKYTRWTYYRTRSFDHLAEAAKLVAPHSELAAQIRAIKEELHYRLRIEALESNQFNVRNRQ